VNSSFNIADFATQLAVLLFAVSFHESAHAWMALQFGDTTARDLGRISLNPIRHIDLFGSVILPIMLYLFSGILFGYAKPTPVRLDRTRNPRLADIAVSSAGPLSNLLLAVIGLGAIFLLTLIPFGPRLRESVFSPLLQIAYTFVLVNVNLGIFNLIPLPPLDGSWVLAALLGEKTRIFFAQFGRFGFLILIALSYTGIFGKIIFPVDHAAFRIIQWILS
jgi:Zn-dependent protease